MDVPAMERVVMTAIGFLVLILVLSRGVDILLIWMDKHDWILIPNQDAIRNSNDRFGRMLTELQACRTGKAPDQSQKGARRAQA